MGGRGVLLALTPALLGLAGCTPAPVSVEQAEWSCLQVAQDATRPRTEIGFGIGSGGYRGGYVGVGVSSDYITGRDPAEVYDSCVRRRSGQPPRRPLQEQPGWGR